MTELNRNARLELLAALLSAVSAVILYLWSSQVLASLAGFAWLALPAIAAAVRRDTARTRLHDERDEQIAARATTVGYAVFWVGLVAWGVTVPLAFGSEGEVPLAWVAPVLWVGWWTVTGVRAVTILVLDSRGL
jgi:hypothetical protein